MSVIRFGEWQPDLPDLENPGATVATNVLPAANSYLPFKAPVAFSDALSTRVLGAATVKDSSGDVKVYAGTAAALNALSTTTWSDVSKSGGYATGTGEVWRFLKWEGSLILATNYSNSLQVSTIGGSSFGNVSGNPPNARYIAGIRDFVVLANTTANRNEVRWSGDGNYETWTISSATRASSFILPTGNQITGLSGGERGLVFCENTIWRMTEVRDSRVFQFDEILPGVGTLAPNSIIRYGALVFFWANNGFHVVNNYSEVQDIGTNRVDRYFEANVDFENLDRISATIDPLAKRVHWAYPVKGGSGTPSRILTFDWGVNRWSQTEQDLELLSLGAEAGQTLEGLDSLYATLESIPISLDDPIWAGSSAQIACFDTDHKLCFFTGAAKQATVETSELQLTEGRKSFLRRVRPVVDDSSATVQFGRRDKQSEPVTYTAEISQNTNGFCPTRTNAYYHRIRVNTNGEFTHLQGVEITQADFTPTGASR